MKVAIQNILVAYANRIAETTQYKSWSDDFCRKEVQEATNAMLDALKRVIDWNTITKKEARELHFMPYSDEYPDLYLIPLWLLPIIPIGIKLTTIFGDEITYDGHNIDNDIRFGCIAYGIYIKD